MLLVFYFSSRCAYLYSVAALFLAVVMKTRHPVLFFETGPMLFTFVSLGRFLEHKAKGRTSDALSKLMAMQTNEAVLVTKDATGGADSERKIDVHLVGIGDLIKVRDRCFGFRLFYDGCCLLCFS